MVDQAGAQACAATAPQVALATQADRAACAAVPLITRCLRCDTELVCEPAEKTGTAVFYKPFKGGVCGSAFVHSCKRPGCEQVYDIEGYYSATNLQGSRKVPLPHQYRHPEWVMCSSRTYIHRDYTPLYETLLHTSACSFEALAEASNVLANRHRGPAGAVAAAVVQPGPQAGAHQLKMAAHHCSH
jgi:hypothetical protein